jgi:hypothetical protein
MDGIQEGGESDTVMNDSICEQFRDWYERPAARLACSENVRRTLRKNYCYSGLYSSIVNSFKSILYIK